jgi:hypothetical protein
MHRQGDPLPMPKKCGSCNIQRNFSTRTLPWSPSTHWMYSKSLKQCALYLIMVGRSRDNIFSALDRNVWYKIISHTIPPYYFMGSPDRAPAQYCDTCIVKLYRLPPCMHCDTYNIPPRVSPDIRYEIVDGEFIAVPAVCRKCRARLYTCALHSGKPALMFCDRCTNPRNIVDAFKSSNWVNIPILCAINSRERRIVPNIRRRK